MREAIDLETTRVRTECMEKPASQAVIEAVAEAEGVEPVELSQPLFEVVDPDALDRFFGTLPCHRSIRRASFMYMDYRVTIHPDGDVELVARPSDASADRL